jgi:hypothetical protein
MVSAHDEMPRTGDATSLGPAWTRREPWLTLAVLGLAFALALAGSQPPSPAPESAPANEFSAKRAIASLARILGDGEPHPVGSLAHERVRERLCAEIANLGLEPSVQETLVAGSHEDVALVRNVLARIPGREHVPAVMLASHYDSVAAGPGAGDDGAGVAAALEVARALRAGSGLRHDVILLFSDGEELGLLGARAFCRDHPWARDVAIAVNLEGRGTEGPSSMFETNEQNGAEIDVLARAVPRPSAVSAAYEVYKRMPNDTDLSVFKRAGMSGFNFAFIGGVHRYHTPRDDLAHLDAASVQHHGDNALPLVRELADGELPLSSRGNAVYFDVLGRVLVHWPESFALPIALVEAALLGWSAIKLRRAGAVAWSGVARGGALALEIVGGAAIAGYASQALAVALSGTPEPWRAHGSAMAIVVATSALCAAAVAVRFGARRARALDAWLGAWCLAAAIGIAVAARVPSASYLFAIPCGVAAPAAALLALRSRADISPIALHAPLVATAAVWFALAIGLTLALEYHVCAVTAATVAIGLTCAVPAWIPSARERLRIVLALSGVVWLAAQARLALFAPTSFDDPAPLSFAHVVDADRREERWLAASYGWKLPHTLDDANGGVPAFAATEPNSFRWWTYDTTLHATASRALAPDASIEAPVCSVSRDERTPNGRELELVIHSMRDAPGMMIRASSSGRIQFQSLRIRDHTLASFHAADGVPRIEILSIGGVFPAALSIIGARGDPIELSIRGPEGAAIELEIQDVDRLEPSEAPALFDARPESRVPIGHGGDASIIVRRTRI